MNVIELEPPRVEPVSLDEMRTHLKVDVLDLPPVSEDDDEIRSAIRAAREYCETYTHRAFVQRRFRFVTDLLPSYWGRPRCGCWNLDRERRQPYIEIPRPPLRSVEAVSYRTSTGAIESVDPATYWIDTDQEPGRLYFVDCTWPLNLTLRVDYTAGYPTTGSPDDFGVTATPERVKMAMKFHARLSYDEISADKRPQLEKAVNDLLESLLVPVIA